MTVHIPTGEFTGLLEDVMPFACPDPELPRIHAVRIEYDGEALHAMATDDVHAGVSTWHPDDLPDGEGTQEGLFARRGGADNPWHIVISLTDAADLVKKVKLKEKDRWVPLGLDFIEGVTDVHRLRVARNTDSGYPGLTVTVLDRDVEFPSIRGSLDREVTGRPVTELEFNPVLLGHFGQVRMRGDAMKITPTGEQSMAVVTIGDRFVGGIVPVRRSSRRLSSVA
ncbi:hypothetical protein E1211_24855 [Micromonospora sp. 15K316]|uniref:hypothetical protein n=1 Tax=Micromonospora sp. 15K316 TaxID=2530376 RepID=UPI00104C5B3F|nr:hypothetical protein [Micromonospora sp. 15K316]TDC30079.1 hypothetical protein E1211_24855 [Micromonospora sp. 15K316]